MPSVVNLNGYGARVATDYVEPGHSAGPHYKFRPRMRGEKFNQLARVNYVFNPEVGYAPIPMSLSAFHDQRLIVAEIDVATLTSLTAEHPNLSKRKMKFATQVLGQLRSKYDGIWARLVRLLRRKRESLSLSIEGPFIPYEPGIALVSLVIRVGRDSNFDDAYQIAKRFFELHPRNEDFERFQKIWNPNPSKVRKDDCYQWSNVELRAIEYMAPLEPTDSTQFGFNRTEAERTRFNEITWKRCQERLERMQIDPQPVDASGACTELLREYFNCW